MFIADSAKIVLDGLYAIKNMKQSENVNFELIVQQVRAFVKARMEPILTYFKRGNISEEERFDLGCAIANVYEFLEGQLSQLIGSAAPSPQED
jgi:hypothetical protein